MKLMDISGIWEMKPVERFDGRYDETGWVKTDVPGHWQLNPAFEFYGGKMLYRKHFTFPEKKAGRRYRLRVNGAFYWSIMNLNNARVGENEGYFFARDYEVTDVLEKENDLLIELDCPDEKNKNAKRLVTGVFSHWDCLDPKTNPGGIWLPVEIHESGDTWLEDPMVHASYWTDSYLRVEARVSANSTKRCKIKVRVTLSPHNFQGKTHVHEQEFLKSPGKNSYLMLLNLDEWELWWTYDHGKPNLYDVKMSRVTSLISKPG
jgi:beta-mannosidase